MPDLGSTSFSQTDSSNDPAGSAAPNTIDNNIREIKGAVTREWNHRSYTVTAGGTADAKTLTYSVAPDAYRNGQRYAFIANTTNTGSATLNVNSLGAKTIKKDVLGTLTALSASDMTSGMFVEVAYNASDNSFVWVNRGSQAAQNIFSTIAVSGQSDVVADSETDTLTLAAGSNVTITTDASTDTVTIAASASAMPAGSVTPYAGTTEPSGWLFCYGQAVDRTTYAALFTAISTTYGVGDGSTTFNLPDLRGRVVAGKDDMGGVSANRLTDQSGGLNGDTLGDTGGAETHTLITAEMPAHTHTHSHTSTTSGGGSNLVGSVDSSSVSEPTGSTGGGGAHNNVQPTIILNYIIKT
jgi:microcystin-dependent protein